MMINISSVIFQYSGAIFQNAGFSKYNLNIILIKFLIRCFIKFDICVRVGELDYIWGVSISKF